MNTIKLEFDVGTSDATVALGIRVLVDNVVAYDNPHVTETYHFSHDISDEDAEHMLSVELYGKTQEHTVVNEAGEITQDALLTINNLQLDSIDIGQVSTLLIAYHHDFNGSQPAIVDQFHGAMGCNGRLELKFTTPVYLWLLENM